MRNEPLPFVEACLGSEDYLLLLERGLAHKHASVRELARDILDQAMNHPDELARLPFALQELVKRLHQRAYSSGNDSGGGSSPPDEPGLHISFTPSTFPKVTPKTPETVRTVSNKVYKVPTYRTPPKSKEEEKPAYRNPPAEMSDQEAMARFRRLAADQQDDLSDRLRALPVEQRRDVLAEWHVRCAAGAVRDAAAYLFGLIRKALQGTFRLWAAHKNTGRERPASKVRETPRETPKSMPSSGTSVAKPADKPASREVAAVYLQRMKAMLQGTANAAHPIRATKPPEHRPLVRAVAQAISQASQPRPLAAFLTPAMETAR
ncbi:MAG: hypothetical protein LBE06_00725 [Azoarcus sp.]|nr:hypothetical protein [Azoarcus sp.]